MAVKAWLHKNRVPVSVILVLLAWGGIFYFIPPDALIARVGIGNAYAVSFLVALFAGFSFITGTAAYATVIEFTRGGADPVYLGIAAGIGLFLSDSVFYLLLMRGRRALSRSLSGRFSRFHRHIERLPHAAVYMGTYLFCAFGPIPNDAIIAILIIAGYEYKKVWPSLLAGDITFMLFLSFLFAGVS